MTLAIMKTHFPKQTQNIVEYGDCDFKKFPSDLFRRETKFTQWCAMFLIDKYLLKNVYLS